MSKPVLIIGAGVSGLAFAQGLSKYGIPFEVYDRDVSITARAQGYRFRISNQGLHALEQNLTNEQMKRFRQGCCSDELVSNVLRTNLLDPQTAEHQSIPPQLAGRTRPKAASVDRSALRNLLLDGIEQHVHFGKTFKSYAETEEGVTVRFIDGSEAAGIAIVGADGTWSKVRQQLLPGFHLVDTEGRLIFGKTDITDELLSRFLPECAEAPSMFLGRSGKFLAEPMYFSERSHHTPANYMYWVLYARSDDDIMNDCHHTLSADESFALAQKMTRDWHPSLRCLIENANKGQTALFSILSARPTIRMQSKEGSRVTLLGDAIHPMSPTAGKSRHTEMASHDS